MIQKLEPMEDRVVVYEKPNSNIHKNPSGLQFVDNNTSLITSGIVMEVGPGKQIFVSKYPDPYVKIPVNLQVGDQVLFIPDSKFKIKINGQYLFIIKESDILSKVIQKNP